MAERYNKAIRVKCDIKEAYKVCCKVCENSKMNISYHSCEFDCFQILAAERINWLSTSWPTKVEITGSIFNGNIVIEVSSESVMGSITQAQANSNKLNGIIESILAYIGN